MQARRPRSHPSPLHMNHEISVGDSTSYISLESTTSFHLNSPGILTIGLPTCVLARLKWITHITISLHSVYTTHNDGSFPSGKFSGYPCLLWKKSKSFPAPASVLVSYVIPVPPHPPFSVHWLQLFKWPIPHPLKPLHMLLSEEGRPEPHTLSQSSTDFIQSTY